MAKFEYNWQNGNTSSVQLPSDISTSCDHKSPSGRWSTFAGQIIAKSGDSTDLNDVESYLISGESVIRGKFNLARNIVDYWDQMEIDCANWNNVFRWCSNHEEYCEMTENELETAYYAWEYIPSNLLLALKSIQEKLADVTAQVYTDLDQTQQLLIVQQMIAETNNLISLTAYQNEVRELRVSKQKTQDVFTPIMIVLILIGLAFYLYK